MKRWLMAKSEVNEIIDGFKWKIDKIDRDVLKVK